MMETNDCPSTVDHLRRVLDIQGEKLNQLTNNNREVNSSLFLSFDLFSSFFLSQFIGVQSQLARLRSELEKSEMLRQTLEYELTLLRAQHGKQSAFTQQLQQEHQQRNEQLQQIQTDIKLLQHQKDHLSEEKVRPLIIHINLLLLLRRRRTNESNNWKVKLISYTNEKGLCSSPPAPALDPRCCSSRRIEALNGQIHKMESTR